MNAPRVLDENGQELPFRFPPQPAQLLSVWLSRNGYALNTRCGGRGLCRGCELRRGDRALKACQTRMDSLESQTLTLPRASLHDGSIHGVSAFEIAPGLLSSLAPYPEARGVALDIGTTTLAASFWRGAPPRCERTATRANPQRAHGDNVVSRIQFTLDHPEGLHILRQCLLDEGIQPLLADICDSNILDQIVVTGNPAMLHILAGESLRGLATWPFAPAFLDSRELPPSELGLPPQTRVILLPSPGPFVGSDVLAGALACGCLDAEPPSLLIDFGTNGEILLRNADGLWATATAAGPAFEGGRLQCGAAAGRGVISRFTDSAQLLGPSNSPHAACHAISGAAYVDALALARQSGWLSDHGRLLQHNPLRPAPGVVITEADIAELLQAKAAIQAGWTTLCKEARVDPASLRRVYVAGGFGYHLTPAHARAIGLLPPVPLDHIHLVGNASLAGATLALLTASALPRMDALRQTVRLVELNQTDSFEDSYIDALSLPICEFLSGIVNPYAGNFVKMPVGREDGAAKL